MSLTLGLTGMDPATETALKAAFIEANARLGERWSLVPDAEAGHVIVDMDSMYGPMSWLRLHAAGRQVIGLTSAPRTQTDFRLGRPFDIAQLVELLVAVARTEGIELQAGAAPSDTPAAAAPVAEPAPAEQVPEIPQPAPASAPVTADATAPQQALEAEAAPPPAPPPAPVAAPTPPPMHLREAATAPAEAAPITAGAPPQPTSSATTPAADTLAAWLQPGALAGRFRYQREAAPALFIDASADAWFGPTALKPVAACFEGKVARPDFEAMDADAWARETASAGEAQPLSRLRWLGGLLAGGGALLPGLDPQDRFQLFKWPQTEREYPRHFRIATQMMKGPASVAEIAAASGVPEADVADFVNANLATGFAEPVTDAPPAPVDAPKARGGLLGRLRNR